MARCGCADVSAEPGMCACLVQAAPSGNIGVTGTGQFDDPYVLDVVSVPLQPVFIARQVFTAVGTFDFVSTAFPTARWVFVTVVGGGGGGAGANAGAGLGIGRPGGAGGNYADAWLDYSTLAALVPVIVGIGGAGGLTTGAGTAGTNGGQSSFDTVTAAGGRGGNVTGAPVAGPWVTPGAASTGLTPGGQVRIFGSPGEGGKQFATGFGYGGTGGNGGNGMGNGDLGGIMNGTTGAAGSSGNQFGGGGGGACAANGGAFAGGPGGPGGVIVEVWG